jgi:uncharacterized protein YndB with AHSA1/START domain
VPTLQEQLIIVAPLERVFARLAEPERAPEWTSNLIRVERISPIAAGPGLETRLLANIGGRHSAGFGRCLAWDPPRRLVLESRFEIGLSSVTTFELTSLGPQTQLTARIDYGLPPKGLARLVGGLLGDTLARRELKKSLLTLKQQLEAERV